MRLDRDSVLDFFEGTIGRILIVVGVLLIGVGLLSASSTGSIAFALSVFSGVLLIVIGFVIHVGLFNINVLSRDGFGTLLICISPLLIAAGFIAPTFGKFDLSHADLIPRRGHTRVISDEWVLLVPLVRLYAWLAMPLFIIGTVSFVAGVLLKVLDNAF